METGTLREQTVTLEQLLPTAASSDEGKAAGTIARGFILDLPESGEIVVRVPRASISVPCDFLEPLGQANPVLRVGDEVLVLLPEGDQERGCVLGRVGKYRTGASAQPQDHVVIEAGETLSLKCGESSVDLRKDGKLMIRGNDVLSRAKRTQRIKGGSVAIN
jgi:hypothetical protein